MTAPSEGMTSRGRLGHNTAAQYLLQLAKYILPFLTLPYLTRVLGPDAFGARAFVLAIMTFIQLILEFGFTQYGSVKLVVLEGNRRASTALVYTLTVAKVLLLAPVSAILLLALQFPSPLAHDSLFSTLSFIAIALATLAPDFVFIAQERLGVFTTRYVASKSIGVALTFGLIHGPNDLVLLGAIDVLSAATAVAWTWAKIGTFLVPTVVSKSLRQALTHLKHASLYFLPNLSGTVMSPAATLAIGLSAQGLHQIAYWSVSITVLNAANSLYVPFSNAMFAHMVNGFDPRLARKALLLSFPVGIILWALVYFSSPYLMSLLGGPNFVAGTDVLQAVSPLVFLGVPVVIMGWPLLGAAGHVKKLTLTSVSSTCLMLVALAVLAIGGWLSIAAVIAARIAAEVVLLVLRLYYTRSYSLIQEMSAPVAQKVPSS